MGTSSTDKPATSFHKSNDSSISKAGQASETVSQHQERRKHLAAYQRKWRAEQPKGHRKVDYRKYIAKETDAHREERLRKRSQKEKAKRKEAKAVK